MAELPRWMARLWRPSSELDTLPLGSELKLPWHTSVAEARRALREAGLLSLEQDGFPTARVRWGESNLRASLEFVPGVAVGDDTWLPAHANADFYTRDGFKVQMLPRLRAAVVPFIERNHRANWNQALKLLGKPHGRAASGDWQWQWRTMEALYVKAPPDDAEARDALRFASRAGSRVLEVRNQSTLELYERVRVRVDFKAGTWEMGRTPDVVGVPVRLHWDTPQGEPLLVTVVAEGREQAIEVSGKCRKVILSSDGRGGVRIVA